MKKITVVLVLFLGGGSSNLLSQNLMFERPFEAYTDRMLSLSNIDCVMPEKFVDLSSYEFMKIREDRMGGAVYNPIILSKDKDCIIMYNTGPLYTTPENHPFYAIDLPNDQQYSRRDSIALDYRIMNEMVPRKWITYEMRTALGHINSANKVISDSLLDFDEYVTIISGREIREKFNADSLYIYEVPLLKPYKNTYVHCTGLLIKKRHRTTMMLKLFFTVRGKKKENYYLDLLNKTIWYREMN